MIERLERPLVLAAYIVLRHGPIYAPYIDRLERELEAARQNDPTERAKRILATYAVHGDPECDAAREFAGSLEELRNVAAEKGGHRGKQCAHII
jgi:coproporphyrinogen III oxidase-like Fe-S oxidoreductase